MEIKKLIVSTYYGGIKHLTPSFFEKFNFEEEVLKKEYPRGFLLGVKLLQNEDGSTSAMLEEEHLEEIMSCPVILLGDHFDALEIIDRLADDTTGLIYHTQTCDEQKNVFKHKCFSRHVKDGSDAYAYAFGLLNRGSKLTCKEIRYILEDFEED